MRFLDVLAAIVVLALLGALIVSPYMGVEMPDEIKTSFGVAMGWVFRSGTNGLSHLLKGSQDNGG